MERNRLGDVSELKACAWLLEQGYEVFRNVGCTGPIDLVAIKEGEILQIDVKTLPRRNGEFIFRTSKHEKIRASGIKLLWVYEDQVGWNRDYFYLEEIKDD